MHRIDACCRGFVEDSDDLEKPLRAGLRRFAPRRQARNLN